MLKILLLFLVKLSFVPIRNIHEPAVFNGHDHGHLSGVFAFQDLHYLTDLQAALITQDNHLHIQFRENFMTFARNGYRMLKVSAQGSVDRNDRPVVFQRFDET